VDDGRNGILVEPGDPAALASGIRRAQIVARRRGINRRFHR